MEKNLAVAAQSIESIDKMFSKKKQGMNNSNYRPFVI